MIQLVANFLVSEAGVTLSNRFFGCPGEAGRFHLHNQIRGRGLPGHRAPDGEAESAAETFAGVECHGENVLIPSGVEHGSHGFCQFFNRVGLLQDRGARLGLRLELGARGEDELRGRAPALHSFNQLAAVHARQV